MKNKPPKFLVISLIVLAILVAVAAVVLVKGRPQAANKNPLQNETADQFKKIVIQDVAGSIEVEQREDRWWVVSPVEDWAEPETIKRLVENLIDFKIGTLISENPDRYETYEVQGGKGTHIQVYLSDADQPALDGYTGKQGASFGSVFFRFADHDPVYIAHGLPTWVINKPVTDYRIKQLIPVKPQDMAQITVQSKEVNFDVVKDSETWTNSQSGEAVDTAWITTLSNSLATLRSFNFGTEADSSDQTGFSSPFMTITVVHSSGTTVGRIGNFTVVEGKKDEGQRYAQTEGRQAVLILSVQTMQSVIDHMKSLPKLNS